MLYMVTFTINIPPRIAYMPYMDPMGYIIYTVNHYNIYYNILYIYYTAYMDPMGYETVILKTAEPVTHSEDVRCALGTPWHTSSSRRPFVSNLQC